MKRVLEWGLCLALFLPVIGTTAEHLPSAFDLQAQPINQVVSLYYKEVAKRPYVMCNELIQDARLVSIRASGKLLDAAMLAAVLETHGYEAKERKGITLVCTRAKDAEPDYGDAVVYRPLHRDAGYLVDFLTPLVRGTFANKRAAAASLAVGADRGAALGMAASGLIAPTVAPSMKPGIGDDYIVFSGSEREKEKLRHLLSQVDVPSGEVVIKGYVYEVGKNSSEASTLDMLASLLKGKLQVSVAGPVLGNALRIKAGSLDLVASALSSDARFKVVTSPYTRVRSGASARFVVGAEVPVLGAILTGPNGQSQQSVEYRSAGAIFEVSPKVRDKSTDVELFQQISSFVQTESGVNGSPTLNKRELRTSLTVEDGEVLVIGGLNDSKVEEAKSGLWFLPFPTSSTNGSRYTELVLVLELQKI